VEDVDAARIDAFVSRAAQDLTLALTEGGLQFTGAEVTRTDPVPGAEIDTEALRQAALAAVSSAGADTLVVRTRLLAPATTTADVDAALAQAERALSGPVTLRRGPAAIVFSPDRIGTILQVVPGEGGRGLELSADPAAVAGAAGDVSVVESEPVDATVRLVGGVPTVVEGVEGFSFDAERATRQLLAIATGTGSRDAELDGIVVAPDRTTEEAVALRITQKVGEFTTNHACCQSRVTNIHRIADIMDGVIVDPGETFSVNDFVGERTIENGFVGGGAIEDGEFIEAVGGGVSQFATTMFNAAFFGGYEIVEHKPHSQYISRYPEGREATLNFPNVDLKVHNSSPHGLLVDTSYTDTSITVAVWATPWVAVDSVTGPRSRFTDPATQVRETTELPPGVERVIQEGAGQGFDVTVTRTLTFPDGRTASEDLFTRYVARPRIVERGV
jgi:vancomycin resistance protein YoaR